MARIRFDPDLPAIVVGAALESRVAKRRVKMVVDAGATCSIIPREIVEL